MKLQKGGGVSTNEFKVEQSKIIKNDLKYHRVE
jgi:adenine-specific DNA methylase